MSSLQMALGRLIRLVPERYDDVYAFPSVPSDKDVTTAVENSADEDAVIEWLD